MVRGPADPSKSKERYHMETRSNKINIGKGNNGVSDGEGQADLGIEMYGNM